MKTPPGKRLIVNADDFGIHPCVNRGIIEAYQDGILTSATLLTISPHAESAARLALANQDLSVGVHLSLLDFAPVLPADRVPSLVRSDGTFPPSTSLRIFRDLFFRKLSLDEIEIEFDAQIGRAKELGVAPTHLDSHNHVHMWPSVLPRVIKLARKHGIRAMRVPRERLFLLGEGMSQCLSAKWVKKLPLTCCARMGVRKLTGEFAFSDNFEGMYTSGRLDSIALSRLLSRLRPGVTEIMSHPGRSDAKLRSDFPWNYSWDAELAALTMPGLKARLKEDKIELIGYRELATQTQ